MIFSGSGDAIYFYNFATRQKCRELPGEVRSVGLATAPPLPPGSMSSAEHAALKKRHAIGKRATKKEVTEEAKKPPPPSMVQKQQARAWVAELASVCQHARKSTLQLRPRSLPEIMVASTALKVDIVLKPQLFWIIDMVLACDYEAVGWVKMSSSGFSRLEADYKATLSRLNAQEKLRFVMLGEVPLYFNNLLCAGTELHPMQQFVQHVMNKAAIL